MSLNDRLRSHILEALAFEYHRPKDEWVREIIRDNSDPLILLLEEVPSGQDWEAREKYWVSKMRASIPDLTNVCDGGLGASGAVRSPAQRARISEVHTGLKRPEGTGAKISAARMGHVVTQETRDKIRATKAANQRPISAETRAKMSAASKGRPKAPEALENMRAAHRSAEARAKKKQAMAGLIWITDGIKNSRIPSDAEIPAGWKLGRTLTEAQHIMYQQRRKAKD